MEATQAPDRIVMRLQCYPILTWRWREVPGWVAAAAGNRSRACARRNGPETDSDTCHLVCQSLDEPDHPKASFPP